LNWVRQDSWTRLLRPIMQMFPNNINLIINTTVTKINFKDGKADSVNYINNNGFVTLKAKKEIILSAGPIHTPQLLMLSGIGNCSDLANYNIECVYNSPGVGKHLQNQLFYFFGFVPSNTSCTKMSALYDLHIKQKSNPSSHISDTEILMINGGSGFFMSAQLFDHTPSFDDDRAYLTLNTNNPFDQPLITFNSFGSPQNDANMEPSVYIINALRDWINNMTCPWIRIIPSGGDLPYDYTDDQLKQWIVANVGSAWHYAGTTKMGNDTMSVVDDHLRVRGVQNLRVVDLSAVPFIPSTHTNPVALVVGSRAATIVHSL